METLTTKRKHPLAKCEECPLAKQRCAPTSGPLDAKVAIVSRSPGYHDVNKKRPFSGPSGKVLDHLLKMYKVNREDVLTTNVVLCKTENPPLEAIRACGARLQSELGNAHTIIAAGAEAFRAIVGGGSMAGARGYPHYRTSDATGHTQRVIVTNNPALVLRDDSAFPNLVRDFRLALDPLPEPELPKVRWTNDIQEGREWLQRIHSAGKPLLAVDIETLGLRRDAPIVALGISVDGKRAVSFGERVCRDEHTYRNFISRVVARTSKSRFIYHNGKFDVRNFRAHGVNARVDEDTLLLSWVLDERSDEDQVHSLDYLVMNELSWPHYEPSVVKEWKSKVRNLEKQLRYKELNELPIPDELYEYNALDVGGTAQLFPILEKRAKEDGVWDLYKNFLLPASDALVTAELQGAPYDANRALDLLEEEVWPKLAELKAELQLIVGDGNYNPNSAPQNARLVYDEWKIIHNLPLKNERSVDNSVYNEIKAGRFVIGGFKSGKEALQQAARVKETATRWAGVFKDFKELDKQRSTYLEGLIPRAILNDNRLYTDFKLHNTVSGRLSSSNPNIQNITRAKPGLPNIRSLFAARPGYLILQADYSQAELRCIAQLSGDSELGRIYKEGLDLHDIVAERFYGPDFSKEQRSNTKNMNFGVAYQQTAGTFQEKHDIPEEEAQKFIDWWWTQFPGVREWTNEVAKAVKQTGEVVSPFGHKRRFHLLTRENLNASIREGINFGPQNIAACFTLWSFVQLVQVHEIVPWNEVHDANIFEIEEEGLEDVADLIQSVMVSAPKETLGWDFPFEVDIQIGPSWGELEDLWADQK